MIIDNTLLVIVATLAGFCIFAIGIVTGVGLAGYYWKRQRALRMKDKYEGRG